MPAYYADSVENFQLATVEILELTLTRAYESDRYKDLITTQITSWRNQIQALKQALADPCLAVFGPETWGIAIEFVVPRKMGRIDTVLLVGDALVVLEFKTDNFDSSAADQVEDYCLDLINFHEPSHDRVAYPAVVANTGTDPQTGRAQTFRELQPTMFVDTKRLASWLALIAAEHVAQAQLSISNWNAGDYRPVPTIVEAAIGMFAEMQVEDIAKAGCDPINLTATIGTIRALVSEAAGKNKKTVCFVTGVPGAGKTLAGLQVVHDRGIREATGSDCVFLTGNLPLVKVLQAALSRDSSRRSKQGLRFASRDPRTTINTVLGYKKEYTRNKGAPHEKVVVFDEAQRAWDAEKTAEYLTDNSVEYLGYSEPALLLSILDRQPWATLIALVGGGQEINRGEAGLPEWGRALADKFRHWSIAVSEQALSGAYGAGAKLFEDRIADELDVQIHPNLHLDNPTRQFRGRTIANWTEALLRGNAEECQRILRENPEYPICLTRDLDAAKSWLRSVAAGTERYGCIASSEARRLRAEGLELPPARAEGVDHWFLEAKGDVRSSFQLEVAANEFQVQGLELDWTCVCWGGDFLRSRNNWELKRLRGTVWQKVGQSSARTYLVNSYRVLLTRARQGMVLFVPNGDDADLTRPKGPLDETWRFLSDCGATSFQVPLGCSPAPGMPHSLQS
jgi:schlafen family protein